MIHDANSQYFPKFLVWGSPNLEYRPKSLLLKVTDGSFQVSQIRTTGSNWLKYGLKSSQGSNLGDPRCQQTILPQNLGMVVPKYRPANFRSCVDVLTPLIISRHHCILVGYIDCSNIYWPLIILAFIHGCQIIKTGKPDQGVFPWIYSQNVIGF